MAERKEKEEKEKEIARSFPQSRRTHHAKMERFRENRPLVGRCERKSYPITASTVAPKSASRRNRILSARVATFTSHIWVALRFM